jgi:hypothetical protein
VPHAICRADVSYMWRCRRCFKLAAGFALPLGEMPGVWRRAADDSVRRPADSLHLRAIRQAVHLEVDSFHFFKLAHDQTRDWEQRAVLEGFTKPRRRFYISSIRDITPI